MIEENRKDILLLNCLKFIRHLKENNILDDIEIGNTSCTNCINKIELFNILFEKYFTKNFNIYKEIEKIEKNHTLDEN